jgi:hypothetical protein
MWVVFTPQPWQRDGALDGPRITTWCSIGTRMVSICLQLAGGTAWNPCREIHMMATTSQNKGRPKIEPANLLCTIIEKTIGQKWHHNGTCHNHTIMVREWYDRMVSSRHVTKRYHFGTLLAHDIMVLKCACFNMILLHAILVPIWRLDR